MGATVRLSNRKVGERMVADEVRWLGAKARQLLAAYDQEGPQHRLRTFSDVEALWGQDRRSRPEEFPLDAGAFQRTGAGAARLGVA